MRKVRRGGGRGIEVERKGCGDGEEGVLRRSGRDKEAEGNGA